MIIDRRFERPDYNEHATLCDQRDKMVQSHIDAFAKYQLEGKAQGMEFSMRRIHYWGDVEYDPKTCQW